MNGRIGGQGEKEGTSSQWLGFCFPLLPRARDQRKRVRMCRRVRRCEEGERERAWPIENRVFSGSKVSLQSLLMQSPWEPFNLVAAAISIRRGHLWTHLHTHTLEFFLRHTETIQCSFMLTKWFLLPAHRDFKHIGTHCLTQNS